MRLLYPMQFQAQGWKPYYVYKWSRDGGAAVIRHYPPAKQTYAVYHAPDLEPSSMGLRGIMVKSHDQPMCDQEKVLLCWVGVDVDAEDNDHVGITKGTLGDYIALLFQNEPVVTRSSKSGMGVHLLIPLKNPLELNYEAAKVVAKKIAKRYVDYLSDEGIVSCVHGLPNLWVASDGGKQQTLMITNDLYVPTEQELHVGTLTPAAQPLDGDVSRNFTGLAWKALNALVVAGIVPEDCPARTQINVGRVKRALEKVGIPVETRSKCRVEHEHEPNGFVELTSDGELKVFSSADQGVVFKAVSL